MNANIIYGNFYFHHPSLMRSQRIKDIHFKFYKDLAYTEEEDKKVIEIPQDIYNRFWKKVDVYNDGSGNKKSKTHSNDLAFAEEIYAFYNTNTHPLVTPNGKKKLKKLGIKHTTMTMGDIVEFAGVKYIVSGIGFKRVKIIKG